MKRCGKSIFFGTLGGIALIGLGSAIAEGAGSSQIGSFNAWSAHLLDEQKAKVCYLHAVPEDSSGDYTQRGDTYVQVTHRTSSKSRNEVSVTAGYVYKKDSSVTLTIDGRKFDLFTHADTAWAEDGKTDNALVAAMRAGREMVVGGTSSRGTLTTDRYSLSGFTAAHSAINKACGM
jgi:hypothetical protein